MRAEGRRHRVEGPSGAAALCALALAAPAQAAEWLWQPAVDVASTYDDNVQLIPGTNDKQSGYIVGGRLNMKANTEITKSVFDGYAARTNYSSNTVNDRTEIGTVLTVDHEVSERSKLGLRGEYRFDTLYQRLFVGPGTGNLQDVDVGLSTATDIRRNYRVIEPSWNWLINEVSGINFSYRDTRASFSRVGNTGLVDYTDQAFRTTYSHALNDRTDANVSVNLARFRPDIGSAESKTLQLLGGFTRKLTETVRANASAGVGRTRVESNTDGETSTGVVFTAGLQKRSDTATLDGVLSRDVTPSGLGLSVETNQFRVRWNQQTAPDVEFQLQAYLIDQSAIRGANPNVDRRYYEVEPQLRWQWLENWFVSGSYRVRWQKYDVQQESARSNTVFLGLTWQP